MFSFIFQVPWIHERFCRENLSQPERFMPYLLSMDEQLHSILCTILGDSTKFKAGSLSKYYHRINFELWKCKETGEFHPLTDVFGFENKAAGPFDAEKFERIALLLHNPHIANLKVRRAFYNYRPPFIN